MRSAVPAPRSRGSSRSAFLPLAAAALLSPGCFSARYLAQAARGELDTLVDRRRAPRLLAIGALGTAAAHYLFYLGASRTSAITRSLT